MGTFHTTSNLTVLHACFLDFKWCNLTYLGCDVQISFLTSADIQWKGVATHPIYILLSPASLPASHTLPPGK